MLISEIQDNIAMHFQKSFDIPFKSRIKSEIVSARAEVIKQHFQKYGTYPESLVSQINSTPLRKVDEAETASYSLGSVVSRTTYAIPAPIRMSSRSSNFIYVGTVDGRRAFSYVEPENINDKIVDRFLKDRIWYSFINGYIYIYNSNPKNVRVRGIFSDPYQIAVLNGCKTDNCPQDLDIPEDFVNLIERLVIDLLQRGQITPDKEEEIEVETND